MRATRYPFSSSDGSSTLGPSSRVGTGIPAARIFPQAAPAGFPPTFAEAVHLVEGLLDFRCRWEAGVFYVDKREGGLLRHILRGPDPNRYMVALQKIILSRFLAASAQSGSGAAEW